MNEPHHVPLIEKYSFGSMRVDGRTYYADLAISGGGVVRWWREESHLVRSADIDVILALKPAVLIIGTGYSGGMHVSDEVKTRCEEARVELIIERTAQAVERYNTAALEGKRQAAAAFHLTC